MNIENAKDLLAFLGDTLKQTEPTVLVPRSWLHAFDRMLSDLSVGHDERICDVGKAMTTMARTAMKDSSKARNARCGLTAIALLVAVRLEEVRTGGCIPTETFFRWMIECCGISDMLTVEKSGQTAWVRSNLEAEENTGLSVRAKVLDYENAPSYIALHDGAHRDREDELDAANRLLTEYLHRMGADDRSKLTGDEARRFNEIFAKVQLHRKQAQRISLFERL